MKEFTKYTNIERLYTSAPYIKQLHDHKHKAKAAVVIILGGNDNGAARSD